MWDLFYYLHYYWILPNFLKVTLFEMMTEDLSLKYQIWEKILYIQLLQNGVDPCFWVSYLWALFCILMLKFFWNCNKIAEDNQVINILPISEQKLRYLWNNLPNHLLLLMFSFNSELEKEMIGLYSIHHMQVKIDWIEIFFQPEQIELSKINASLEEPQSEEIERNIEFNTNQKNATLRCEENGL